MGSGKGKTYTYNPDYTAQNAYAEQMRKAWARYTDKYLPVVSKLVEEVGPHPEELDAAVRTSDLKFDQAAKDTMNTLGMYGVQLSPIQREALLTKLNADKTLGAVRSRTLQRRIIGDRNTELRRALVGEGAGVRDLSTQALMEAARAEQERNATGYSIAAAKTARSQAKAQGRMQLIGQGIGTAATVAALA
ncbi:MAG TPA: hypothetical protein PKI80_09555 [Deltaproteobacteria bacterium]|nr:hypothetical protein [Deltaproteobacteria bacterium]